MTDRNVDPVQLDPVPSDLPEDTKYLGDKFDELIALITDIQQASVQQQATPPGIWEILSASTGIALNTDFGNLQLATDVRVTDLIIMGGDSSGMLTLFVGTRRYRFTVATQSRTISVPFPLVLKAGVDLKAQHDGGTTTVTGFYIIGFPETLRPPK